MRIKVRGKLGICFGIILLLVVAIWVVDYITDRIAIDDVKVIKKEIILGCETSLLPSAVWVAENKGYFQDEGLNVKIKEFGSGKTALATMLNEENLDMVTVAQTPVVLNSFYRSDYAIIAAMVSSYDDLKILARQDKGIKNPADLKGEKVGTTKGSTGHFFLGLFLAYHGLDLSKVEVVDLEATDLTQAIVDGRVNAISTWQPHIANTESQLGDKVLRLSSANKELFREDFYFVSNKTFIEKNPEILKSFLKAILRGEEFIRNNREESINIVSERLKFNVELAASIWNAFDFRLKLDQTILVALEDQARWAIKEGLVDKKETPNYLDFIYIDTLEDLNADSVTIIR